MTPSRGHAQLNSARPLDVAVAESGPEAPEKIDFLLFCTFSPLSSAKNYDMVISNTIEVADGKKLR